MASQSYLHTVTEGVSNIDFMDILSLDKTQLDGSVLTGQAIENLRAKNVNTPLSAYLDKVLIKEAPSATLKSAKGKLMEPIDERHERDKEQIKASVFTTTNEAMTNPQHDLQRYVIEDEQLD